MFLYNSFIYIYLYFLAPRVSIAQKAEERNKKLEEEKAFQFQKDKEDAERKKLLGMLYH
jgi:hypothetical protein